jgi:anti-sigma regulatory factor (Ser/Thr protein kinase)
VTAAHFEHDALVYASDAEFLGAVVPFMSAGIAAHDPVLAVTTRDNIALLRDALGRDAPHVEFVDAAAWYDAPARTHAAFDRYVERHRHRSGRVRIVGEPMWDGLDDAARNEWARYESTLNVSFADTPARIVCPYDARALSGEILDHAVHTHPHVVHADTRVTNDRYVDPHQFATRCDALPLSLPPTDTFTLQFGSLASVRRFVRDVGSELGLEPHRVDDAVVAVGEPATNVLRHGDGRGRVVAWRGQRSIVFEVVDAAGGRLPAFAGYLRRADPAVGGHGLFLSSQFADLVELRTTGDGVTVRMRFALPAARAVA